jgi:para-aminobenzoate synthetase component 1
MNSYGKESIPFLFIIDFDMKKPEVYRTDELQENNIYPQIGNLNIKPETGEKLSAIQFDKNPISFSRYNEAFRKVMNAIEMGDSFLLNLTFPTEIRTNLQLKEIYIRSNAKYKLLYKDDFVIFSPEPFIRINNNVISSFPMKGTIDATIKDAEKILLESEKEISEHNTIVDLIRNDLSMVSEKVRVKRFRYVERIKTIDKELLQTSSEISGELPKNWKGNIGDIIFRLLPAGSISGAPKKRTCEIIRDAENYDRGYFTGIFGYFDGKSLDSAVMIRYIEKQGDKMFFKSGGGITSMSKAKEEYEEMIDKVYLPFAQ